MNKFSSSELREKEVLGEIREVLLVVANMMAVPLFLLFWIADLIYVPEKKWYFLALRLIIIPASIITRVGISKAKSANFAQFIVSGYAFCMATSINLMILDMEDIGTSYYAGLNLIAIGTLSFVPLNLKYFTLTAAGIYMPYLGIILFKADSFEVLSAPFINIFFIVGSLIICFLIRYFNENLRLKELKSRLDLRAEIANRDEIIKMKTKEAVRLNALSNQFSPQVVRAIKNGEIDIDKGVHRSEICAIFVDIVDSTDRVVKLDQENIDKVLARFMDTVFSIFLKYDLTIDKFQGDGVLAFANNPVSYDDFVQRTCFSAIEIRKRLSDDKEFYIRYWKNELKIRIGIANGSANVGFYGNKKFFRTYTAIGAPLPFAARLTNLAEPNQILIDNGIASLLEKDGFTIAKVGERAIKGFGDSIYDIFEIVEGPKADNSVFHSDIKDCPSCENSLLKVDQNQFGQYILKCSNCNFEYVDNSYKNIKSA